MRPSNSALHAILSSMLALGAWGCGSDDGDIAEKVKLGLLIPFGDDPGWSIVIRNSMVLAQDEINDAGGVVVDGETYDVEFVVEDTAGDPREGRQVAEELHGRGIDLIVGPAYSSTMLGDPDAGTAGVADYAIENGMLLISYSATNDLISDLVDGDMIFRTAPPDRFQGALGAEYIRNNHPSRTRAGILYRDDIWGRGLKDVFKSEFVRLGGAVVAEVSYSEDAGPAFDFSPALTQLFTDQPDVVYFVTFNELSKISQDILHNGYFDSSYRPFLMSNDGIQIEEVIANGAHDVIEGMYGTQPGPMPDEPSFHQYAQIYQQRFATDADNWSAYVYDAVYLLGYAIVAAGSTDPAAVRDALRLVSRHDDGDSIVGVQNFAEGRAALLDGTGVDYEGASGSIEFNDDGDTGKVWYKIWRIEGNDYYVDSAVQITVD